MQLGRVAHKTKKRSQHFFTHILTGDTQDMEHGVHVPADIGCEPLSCHANTRRETKLELGVGDFEELQELVHDGQHGIFIDERVRKLQCTPAN